MSNRSFVLLFAQDYMDIKCVQVMCGKSFYGGFLVVFVFVLFVVVF